MALETAPPGSAGIRGHERNAVTLLDTIPSRKKYSRR